MPVLPCPGDDGRGAHGVGWPAVSPPRGLSIRRPPKVCQRRARCKSNWLCPITAGQYRHSFAQFDLKCSYPYPFLSPGAWGSPEPGPKFLLSVSCWPILVDFFAFRSALEKRHRKNTEKNAKIKDFPETFPKSFQNQCLEKHAIFLRFFTYLDRLLLCALLLRSA